MTYSADTSALMDAWVRWYPTDIFPSLWERLSQLTGERVIVATEEVLHDLEKKEDGLFDWVKARKNHMVISHDGEIQQVAGHILAQFPKMVDQRTGKSFADPFVIAVARVRGLTVVTGEKGGTRDRPKIPKSASISASPASESSK